MRKDGEFTAGTLCPLRQKLLQVSPNCAAKLEMRSAECVRGRFVSREKRRKIWLSWSSLVSTARPKRTVP